MKKIKKESKSQSRKVQIKLSLTRQSAELEQRFNAAIDLFLAEWVRRQMDGSGENANEQSENLQSTLPGPAAL